MKKIIKKIKCKKIFAFLAVLIVLFAFFVIPVSADVMVQDSKNNLSVPSLEFSFEMVANPNIYPELEPFWVNSIFSPIVNQNLYPATGDLYDVGFVSESGFGGPFAEPPTDIIPSFAFDTYRYSFDTELSPWLGFNFESFDKDSLSGCICLDVNPQVWTNESFTDQFPDYAHRLSKDCLLTVKNFSVWYDPLRSDTTSFGFSFYSSELPIDRLTFKYLDYGSNVEKTLIINADDLEPRYRQVRADMMLGVFRPYGEMFIDPLQFNDTKEYYFLITECIIDFQTIDVTSSEDYFSFDFGGDENFYVYYNFHSGLFDKFTEAFVLRPRTDNPALPLIGYTKWLGTAASGFLDLEIFPQFTLGGIFMTLLAFSCVVWFLKLVAGG